MAKNNSFLKKQSELIVPIETIIAHLSREGLLKLNKKILELLDNKEKPEILVPVKIFSYKLTPAESLTKYLKENKELRICDIARLLGKKNNTVWTNYQNACKRNIRFEDNLEVTSLIFIPIRYLIHSKLSLLESIVVFLREETRLTNQHISKLLKKNQAVLSIAYHRSKSKLKNA